MLPLRHPNSSGIIFVYLDEPVQSSYDGPKELLLPNDTTSVVTNPQGQAGRGCR